MYNRLFFLFCLALHFSSASSQYSLESIMSAPFSSDLTRSDDGSKLAWVTNIKGVRTIHVYDTESKINNSVFSNLKDDGQVLGSLSFSADSNNLYFIKGSATNRSGEIANATSVIDYPLRYLIRVSLRDFTLDTIGNFGNYTLSKDATKLFSAQGNKLISINLDNKKKEIVATIRGAFADVEVDDNDNILFSSIRNDHSFIGLIENGAEEIRWIAPGITHDRFPQFSPDGRAVVFIRSPGNERGYLPDITGANAFEIVVHDLQAGIDQVVYSSSESAGGFAQYYPSGPLTWTAAGYILFYSEEEGFMKIYVVDDKTQTVRSVISGECEVEHSNVSPDGSVLIFSTNCGDIDRRDLYAFNLMTNELFQVTDTEDIETYPLIMSNGDVAYLKGGAKYNTGVVLFDGNEEALSTEHVADFPSDQLVAPQQVIYRSTDGLEIHGQLFDNGIGDDKPAVIFMHGGPIRQMLLGFHYRGYYANCYAFNQFLASRGYVVLSVNFRAGIGYGAAFRRADNQGPRGASEYQDIVAGARYLQSLSNVDPQRIGLWGGSYGGYLTAMGLARNSELFKAGVDLHGVHDWSWRAVDFSEGGFWGIDEELMDEAFNSSPVASIDTWKSPVLLIHGDDDRNVMFGQTIDLANRLKNQGVEYEFLVLPDEVHGFYRWKSWMRTFHAASDFFDRKLKP